MSFGNAPESQPLSGKQPRRVAMLSRVYRWHPSPSVEPETDQFSRWWRDHLQSALDAGTAERLGSKAASPQRLPRYRFQASACRCTRKKDLPHGDQNGMQDVVRPVEAGPEPRGNTNDCEFGGQLVSLATFSDMLPYIVIQQCLITLWFSFISRTIRATCCAKVAYVSRTSSGKLNTWYATDSPEMVSCWFR